MKNAFLLLLFCLLVSSGCLSTRAGKVGRFQRVEVREENLRIGGLSIPSTYTYRLSDHEVIAFVFDTSMGEHTLPGPGPGPSTFWGPGWVLFLVDKDSNRVTCRSAMYEDGGYGWELNIYNTWPYVFILWEVGGEYYTDLSLFVYHKKSRTCSYAGDFDVNQYFDGYYESSPYPIEGIYIEASDTLVSFKFTEKLWLMESDTSSLVADSLTYELDLRSDSLRVAKIWASDTLR